MQSKSLLTHSLLLKVGALVAAFGIGIAIKDPVHEFYKKMFTKTISESEISTLYMQGIELHSANKLQEAAKLYKKALTTNPDVTKTLVRLGAAAAGQNKFTEAIHYYKTALSIEPRHLNAYVSLGIAHGKLEENEEAVRQFEIAIAIEPKYYEAHLQLSKTYMDLKQWEKAIEHAKKAIELQPNNIHSHLNMGHVYNKQGNLDMAVKQYEKVIAMDPKCANAYYNLGYTLRILKRTEEAIKVLTKASDLQENYVDAHVCLAQCYWTLNNFDKAWPEYEWRWQMLGINPRKMDVPIWEGQDLRGKSILLYCEQGLGDTLQFIRFAKLVKQRGGTVVCKVQKPLTSILKSYPYVDKLITDFSDKTKFDYQIPLLNVPGVIKTKLETIPAEIPYLKADAKLVEYWKQKLAHDKKYKVGLCWHVDPEHELDKSPWALRSVPLSLFVPLSDIQGTSFYSLQKINGEEQLKDVPDSFSVHTFGYNFDEKHGRFMDTAAVIMNLDLVICVDTSVAHLAAAMGKKVWMLMPYSPDCRWYDDRADTPWYPTMRLFRQPKPYDWASVGKELVSALKKERAL
jgi:tetratricopeptide (TPR) repeat protein